MTVYRGRRASVYRVIGYKVLYHETLNAVPGLRHLVLATTGTLSEMFDTCTRLS